MDNTKMLLIQRKVLSSDMARFRNAVMESLCLSLSQFRLTSFSVRCCSKVKQHETVHLCVPWTLACKREKLKSIFLPDISSESSNISHTITCPKNENSDQSDMCTYIPTTVGWDYVQPHPNQSLIKIIGKQVFKDRDPGQMRNECFLFFLSTNLHINHCEEIQIMHFLNNFVLKHRMNKNFGSFFCIQSLLVS